MDTPKIEHTERGFRIAKFTDRYGDECSLQKSSLATEDCIWFGISQVKPIIMAHDARVLADSRRQLSSHEQYRVEKPGPLVRGEKETAEEALTRSKNQPNGWVEWPIPEEVQLHARMHLTQDMVKALLPALQHFAETGELPEE